MFLGPTLGDVPKLPQLKTAKRKLPFHKGLVLSSSIIVPTTSAEAITWTISTAWATFFTF